MDFQRGKKHEELEVNLVPLIDVLLVIIIFLVVNSTFTRLSELEVELPTATANPQEDKVNNVMVSVNSKNEYMINKNSLPAGNLEDLKRLLSSATAGKKDTIVVISADAKSSHQSVINVMEAARQLGLSHITFATQRE